MRVMVFAGVLNKQLSAAITAEGQPRLAICAADAACFSASPCTQRLSKAASGMSGISPASMFVFWSRSGGRGCFPSLLLPGADNELYNITPTMRSACRSSVEATHLIYLTDVAGVWTAKKFFRPSLAKKLTA